MSTSKHPVEHEELMAYLDGELAPGRAAEAAEHLERCPQCRQLAADLREVSQMVAAWQVEEAEREPAKNVAEAFESRTPKNVSLPSPWNPRNWPKPVWGLAGIAAALLLVIVLNRPRAMMDRVAVGPSRSQQPPSVKVPKTEAQNGSYDSFNSLEAGKQPAAPPATTGDSIDTKLVDEDELSNDEQKAREPQGNPSNVPAIRGPMIIRTAELEVTTDAFDKARASVEDILKRHNGWVGALSIETPTGSSRSLTGTLRVPSDQLEATLTDLKGLGRTEKESQGGQEVTQQYVDLEARLANSKHTEQRLVEMLRDRSGKLSDVLAVEMQISRVRGEIEEMEAQRKTMKNQVDYATISVTVAEAYKAELKAVPTSTGTQFRNAAIEGYRTLVDGIIALLLWLLSAGPSLLVWAAILFFPARYAWKRLKPRLAQK